MPIHPHIAIPSATFSNSAVNHQASPDLLLPQKFDSSAAQLLIKQSRCKLVQDSTQATHSIRDTLEDLQASSGLHSITCHINSGRCEMSCKGHRGLISWVEKEMLTCLTAGKHIQKSGLASPCVTTSQLGPAFQLKLCLTKLLQALTCKPKTRELHLQKHHQP